MIKVYGVPGWGSTIPSLDKLNDRAVKYNLDNNGDVDKTKR